MHIGYLVQDFPPEVGAGPARVLEMSKEWQRMGARVTVITGMPNRRLPGRGDGAVDPTYRGRFFLEEQWEGVRVLRSWLFASERRGLLPTLGSHLSFTISSFLNVAVRRERFDVLIASSPPFLPQLAGVLLGISKRTPVVLEIRDLWPDYMVELGMLSPGLARRSLFALERSLLARADETVVVTESFRSRVIGKGVPAERVHVIPNGVDLDRYYPEDSPAPLETLRNHEGETVVGYLGTFGRGQALTTVVEAAAKLDAGGDKVRFVLVGDGPDRPAIDAAIAQYRTRAVDVHPPIPRDATRAFYNSCDICLVPLAPVAVFQETIPSKIFEIMACERPLVASLAGEGARVVEESRGGISCPPGDALALSESIKRMLALSEHQRREMGLAAGAYVRDHYDRKVLAKRYFEILTRLKQREARGGAPTSSRHK